MKRRIGRTAVVLTMASLAGCAPRRASGDNLLTAGIFAQLQEVADGLVGDRYFVRALRAETTLARKDFVPRRTKPYAGVDMPLAIGWAQTISDSYIVVVMTHLRQLEDYEAPAETGPSSSITDGRSTTFPNHRFTAPAYA